MIGPFILTILLLSTARTASPCKILLNSRKHPSWGIVKVLEKHRCRVFILLQQQNEDMQINWHFFRFCSWCREAISQNQSQEVLCKKSAPKSFANFTAKRLCWGLFLIKLLAWMTYFEYLFWRTSANNCFCFQNPHKLLRDKVWEKCISGRDLHTFATSIYLSLIFLLLSTLF